MKSGRKAILFLYIMIAQLTSAQFIGANFNEGTYNINMDFVKQSGVSYVRGFVDVPKFFINFDTNGNATGVNPVVDNYINIDPLVDAQRFSINGETMKLAFSLKLRFKHEVNGKAVGVPAAGSSEEAYYFDAIERFLVAKDFGGQLAILGLGNEPMWETPTNEAAEYKIFLERLISKVAQWRNDNDWNFDIYVGALNRSAELPNNAILKATIEVVKSNTLVDGIDLHIHAITMDEFEDAFKFIRETHKLTETKIICTEYSLHRLLLKHRNDNLGSWGAANGFTSQTKLYEFLNTCMDKALTTNPISRDVFKSYFYQTNWFPKGWFADSYNAMKKYNVTGAFYRLQSEIVNPPRYLNNESAMWLINPLYPAELLGYDNNGDVVSNPLHYEDYRSIIGYPEVKEQEKPIITYKTVYHETYGTTAPTTSGFPANGITVGNYSNYSNQSAVHYGAKGNILVITPPVPSDNEGASGGSCMYFSGASKDVDYIIKDINTMSANKPVLALSAMKPDVPNASISAYSSVDMGSTWQIIYGLKYVSNSDGWLYMQSTSELPVSNNLWLKIHTSSQHTLIDDLKILSVDESASINNAKMSGISCYPNPASSTLYINSPDGAEFYMYSPTGQLILQSRINTIDVSTLSSGLYYLRVNNETQAQQKIAIIR